MFKREYSKEFKLKNSALEGADQSRFIRFRSLGEGYTVGALSVALAGEKSSQQSQEAGKKQCTASRKSEAAFSGGYSGKGSGRQGSRT